MTRISEIWQRYRRYVVDLTEQSRKLAFAAAAICWFFKTEDATFPTLILLSLACIVLFFAFDLLHSLTGALRNRRFARAQEIEHWESKESWDEVSSIDIEVEVPESLDKPVFGLFMTKLAMLMLAFIFLIAEFCVRIV